MNRKTLSLITSLAAIVTFVGLQIPSRADGTGRIYFSGNITMPDKSLLKVYVSGTIDSTGKAFGNAALLGPDGRVMAYMKKGAITSSATATIKTATVYQDLLYRLVVDGTTYMIPARMQVDVSKSSTLQTLGWRIVSTDTTPGSPAPAGTVLWESGTNADGSILQKNVRGICFILVH